MAKNSKPKRELVFSLTKKDFEIEAFCAGGKGGQNQNKTASGCRIRHPESGAVSESRRHREFLQNKKEAFEKLVETDTFKKWHRLEYLKRIGVQDQIKAEVEKLMDQKNIRIEVQVNGKWQMIDFDAVSFEDME